MICTRLFLHTFLLNISSRARRAASSWHYCQRVAGTGARVYANVYILILLIDEYYIQARLHERVALVRAQTAQALAALHTVQRDSTTTTTTTTAMPTSPWTHVALDFALHTNSVRDCSKRKRERKDSRFIVMINFVTRTIQ